MTPALRSAIERAYGAFAAYRVGPDLDFSARIHGDVEKHKFIRHLLSETPLRELPLELIDAYFDYIDSAHYQGQFRWDEFRYFLPRALELIATGESHLGAPWLRERLERAFRRGRIRKQWPFREIDTLDRFFATLGPPTWK